MSRFDTQEELDTTVAGIKALSDTDLIHHLRSSYAYYEKFRREKDEAAAARQIEYHEMTVHEMLTRLNATDLSGEHKTAPQASPNPHPQSIEGKPQP